MTHAVKMKVPVNAYTKIDTNVPAATEMIFEIYINYISFNIAI